MSAVAIHEKIALDSLDREQSRAWIIEHDDQFAGMDIPAVILAEVRRKILGTPSEDPSLSMEEG